MFVPLTRRPRARPLDLARAAEVAWDTWLHKRQAVLHQHRRRPQARATSWSPPRQQGKIYRVRGRRDVAVIADLEERQATGLCPLKSGGVVATAGDGAAVYRLAAAAATTARYRSKVFDAKQPATYGAVYLRGAARSSCAPAAAPSEEVDKRWSEWKTVALVKNGDAWRGNLGVPGRRYVQLEARLSDRSELRDICSSSTPRRTSPRWSRASTSPSPEFEMDDDGEPDSKLTIKWKAEARDDDDLVYEVRIRPEGSTRRVDQARRRRPDHQEGAQVGPRQRPRRRLRGPGRRQRRAQQRLRPRPHR
jgi:hypothetical protein